MVVAPNVPALRPLNKLRAVRPNIWAPVDNVGFALSFCWQVLSAIPLTLKHYRSQTVMLITDMTWGRGSVIVGGGTAAVMAVLVGTVVVLGLRHERQQHTAGVTARPTH